MPKNNGNPRPKRDRILQVTSRITVPSEPIMRAENLKTKFIDDILRYVGERIERPRQKQVEDFIRAFYANVASDDIADTAPEDLFSAALSLFNFAQKRTPGAPKIRVFNPEVEEHGWKSPHTVLDIVNDD